jgi:hypothetical protein
MTDYRLMIEDIKDAEVITSYTRWVEAVQVRGADNQEVYLTFSPRFEHIWLESKKRLLEYVAQKPANIGLRSQLRAKVCEFDPPRSPRRYNSHLSSARVVVQGITYPR